MTSWHCSVRGLIRPSILRECQAGIAMLAVDMPSNTGYAQIARWPATAGLYSLVVPTLVHAFGVSSR